MKGRTYTIFPKLENGVPKLSCGRRGGHAGDCSASEGAPAPRPAPAAPPEGPGPLGSPVMSLSLKPGRLRFMPPGPPLGAKDGGGARLPFDIWPAAELCGRRTGCAGPSLRVARWNAAVAESTGWAGDLEARLAICKAIRMLLKYQEMSNRTAAIFAWRDGGMGVEPEPLLARRLETERPGGPGGFLDAWGNGGGLRAGAGAGASCGAESDMAGGTKGMEGRFSWAGVLCSVLRRRRR